jgi:tight adherence protein C
MTLDHLMHDRDLIAGLCGIGAIAVVLLIWFALVESDQMSNRIKHVTQRKDELREAERQKKLSRRKDILSPGMMKQVVQKLKLERGRRLDEIRLRLARAGFRARDAVFTYLFFKLALPGIVGFVVFLAIFVLHMYKLPPALGFVAVIFGGVLGFMLPDIFLKNQSQKRVDVLRKAMPDALDLLVICAEAGLSLDSALDRVSKEMGPSCPELAEEVGLTGVELGFLPERSKALQNLADRVPLPGVMALTNTLIQTEKYGTPLAQSLRVLSGEMRDERMMAAEAKAAKLPATLTIPMILFILPPLFVVLLGPAALKVMGIGHGH